jgi:hypothetical protein
MGSSMRRAVAAAAVAATLGLLAGRGQAATRKRRARPETLATTSPARIPEAPVAGDSAPVPATTAGSVADAASGLAPAVQPADLPLSTPGNRLVLDQGARLPGGFISVPGAHTAFRVAGFLKLDAIHDVGPTTGDASDLPNLALPGEAGGQQRYGLTRLHARESRLSLGTFTDTPVGPMLAFVEVDFFGAGGANTYGLRMRHAYLSWKGLLAGHTFSNFLDVDARGTTVEFNGPTAAGNRKRAQLRLSARLRGPLLLTVALENGATDYTDADGTPVVAADSLLASSSRVVQQIPDLTAQLRYQREGGHLALRAMARQLRVIGAGAAGPLPVLYGYGVALSGRWQPHGRSNLFAQATAGNGLGGYVDDLDGQAATFDRQGQRLVRQLGYAGLLGVEGYLSERWRSNLIGSVSGTRLADSAPAGPGVRPLSTGYAQVFANLIYSPAPDLLIGLEYGYYRRDTNVVPTWSHRLQLAVLYRFGG